MVEGGKAVGKAAGGIIADAVRDLLRVTAKDAGKDASGDVARSVEKDLARDLDRDLEKKLERDFGKDAEQDAGKDATTPLKDRTTCGDPVDVATGEVVLGETDVELAGVLPLVLVRTHVSSYRSGRHFGSSWASTLDQRLEVDAAGVCLLTEDGMRLHYLRPDPGVSVFPERGPSWALARTDDGGYTVTDSERGRTLHFAAAGLSGGLTRPLAAISDRNGNRIEVDRDTAGVPTAVRHSGGYRIGVDSVGGLVSALRLLGSGGNEPVVLVRFGYDQDGRLTEVVNSSGLPMRFGYDAEGRLTGWHDRNGGAYQYVYDAQGRCVRTVGPDGYLTGTFDYDTDARVTVATNSLGHATTFHLDDRGRVVRVADPLGHTTVSEWDDHDRLVARTDPLGRTTRIGYDQSGNVISIIRPDGSRIHAEYHGSRLPVAVTDPAGGTWRQRYDGRGNLLSVTDPTGATTRYGYGEHGFPTAVTDALGNTRRIETDDSGLPVAVTDPTGATTRVTRDSFGRITALTDPLGNTTGFGWTIEGRLAWRRLPDGSTERWVHDGEGNLVEHIDAAGRVARTVVTHFGLPAARTGPDGARLSFSYDTELRLVAVANSQGLVWRYEYDRAGNLVRETDFDGRVLTYAHDAAGDLAARVNGAGETTHFTRDLLGQVVERRSGQTVATFGYDRAGRMVSAVNPDAELVFERDALGRVVAETCNGRTMTVSYDSLGRRIGRRTPSGAESVWEYDTGGRPVAVTVAGRVVRFGRDLAGREVARRIGPQVLLTQTWEPNHHLRSQTLTVGGLDPAAPLSARRSRMLQHRAYSYRPDGHLTGIDDHLAGSRRFDLDPAGRVTAVHGPDRTESYAYDSAGNVTHAGWLASPGTDSPGVAELGDREYAGTQIRRAGNVHYRHDAQGRVVLRQHRTPSTKPRTWHYTWDAADRMVGVTTPDGTRWRYLYDPLGRRIAKQRLGADGSVVEHVGFAWDGVLLAEQIHTAPGPDGSTGHTATVWEWEPGTFHPVSQTERARLRDAPQEWIDQRFYSIVTDLVGTPSELVDQAGQVAWQARTTLWGASVIHRPGTAYCPLRFPGQYHDPETQLNYNFHRYYDPGSGRYDSGDPLGLAPAPNHYAYIPNPTEWLDPLGLAGCRTFYSVQSGADARRLLEHGGEPWPSGLTHGSLRDIFGPGLYTWETRAQADAYLASMSRHTDDLLVLEHRIPESDFARLKSVDMTMMTDDAANDFLDLGAGHGADHIRRMTGRYGPENYFASHVYHLFQSGVV